MTSDPASRNGSTPHSAAVTIQRLVVVGYITAVAMPPIGFILGLVLMLSPRVRSKHGLWIVLTCLIGVGLWIVVVSSGTLSATNENY